MLNEEKFGSLLMLITGALLIEIAKYTNGSEEATVNLLYSSKLYTDLENQKTGIWTFSVPLLFDLWKEEYKTGEINYPD